MSLSAILLTDKRQWSPPGRPTILQPHDMRPASLACVDIFGQSVLQRTIAHLQKAGVRTISVITTSDCVHFRVTADVGVTVTEKPADRWCAAERTLKKDAQHGIDTVLIAELGAYVELDLIGALRFHNAKKQPITCLHDSYGALSYWLVDAARVIASRQFPFPLDEDEMVDAPIPYLVNGHVNRLSNAQDFRRLVVDAFLGRCAITPPGREIKPGAWVDEGAHLHKTARLVAPVYVGRNTHVQPAAVITRFSNLEHNCNIGEGSLVADSSVLPHTIIGKGLDVSAAMVDGNDYFHLNRNIMLRIQDPTLISNAAPEKQYLPAYFPQYDESVRQGGDRKREDRQREELELEYSRYLSRAAGRLLEVFKGEV